MINHGIIEQPSRQSMAQCHALAVGTVRYVLIHERGEPAVEVEVRLSHCDETGATRTGGQSREHAAMDIVQNVAGLVDVTLFVACDARDHAEFQQ